MKSIRLDSTGFSSAMYDALEGLRVYGGWRPARALGVRSATMEALYRRGCVFRRAEKNENGYMYRISAAGVASIR